MSERDELDALMREQGILPTGSKAPTAAPPPRAKQQPARPRASSEQIAKLTRQLGAKSGRARAQHSVSAPKAAPQARLVAATRREEQLSELLGQVDDLVSRTLQAEQQAKSMRRVQRELLDERSKSQELAQRREQRIVDLEAELKRTESQLAGALNERDGARASQSATQRRWDSLSRASAPSPTLRELLHKRGLSDPAEHWRTLTLLADRGPELLLDGLRVPQGSPLPAAIVERLVLVGPSTPAPKHLWALDVPESRCELGVSGLERRWQQVVAAAQLAQVNTLCVVGGSTSYRKQLRALSQGSGGPTLRLVSGTNRRIRRQADTDMRVSDLVIIWGGTELDHKTSELYRGQHVITICHRGISGMLTALSERILELA